MYLSHTVDSYVYYYKDWCALVNNVIIITQIKNKSMFAHFKLNFKKSKIYKNKSYLKKII